LILQLLFIAAIVIIILKAMRPAPMFELRVEKGTAKVTIGVVPPGFRADLEDIGRESSARVLVVRGFRDEHGIRLDFSGDVPESDRQRIRNAWGFHA
jgi:hypothetical protein